MRASLIFMIVAVAASAWAVAGKTEYGPKPFEFYQSIIDRAPFGVIATGDAAGPGGSAAAPEEQVKIEQEQLAKQINMSGITIMPDGTLAVGFADMSVNPAAFYFLQVGKKSTTGWSVVAANYKQEWATIEKEGVQVTIQLGKGVIAAPPAAEVEVKPAAAAPVEVEHATAVGTGFGRLNRPSRAGLPPMPNLKANLEKVKQRQAELAKIRAEGGDVKSYMERLRERNKAEVEAKQAAEEEARQQLTKVAETERSKKERELNLELIRQGARPLSDITLTPEEEKDLVDKGVLSP